MQSTSSYWKTQLSVWIFIVLTPSNKACTVSLNFLVCVNLKFTSSRKLYCQQNCLYWFASPNKAFLWFLHTLIMKTVLRGMIKLKIYFLWNYTGYRGLPFSKIYPAGVIKVWNHGIHMNLAWTHYCKCLILDLDTFYIGPIILNKHLCLFKVT